MRNTSLVLLGNSHFFFLLCPGLSHILDKAALFSFLLLCSFKITGKVYDLQSHKDLRIGLSFSPYLTVFQLFMTAKRITSWKCNLGRVWQGQLVSVSFRISWHGSKTGGWSLLKKGISTLVLWTLRVRYSLLKGTGICRIFSSILDLYPLDASSTLSLFVITKKCQMPPLFSGRQYYPQMRTKVKLACSHLC